jgi:hypothetical protein
LIRVDVRVRPPLLNSLLVRLLASAPDVQVLDGEAADEGILADVVVVSPPDPEHDTEAVNLLYRSPRTRVLALDAGGRRAFLYELRPHRTALGELSRESLLAALRGERAA